MVASPSSPRCFDAGIGGAVMTGDDGSAAAVAVAYFVAVAKLATGVSVALIVLFRLDTGEGILVGLVIVKIEKALTVGRHG